MHLHGERPLTDTADHGRVKGRPWILQIIKLCWIGQNWERKFLNRNRGRAQSRQIQDIGLLSIKRKQNGKSLNSLIMPENDSLAADTCLLSSLAQMCLTFRGERKLVFLILSWNYVLLWKNTHNTKCTILSIFQYIVQWLSSWNLYVRKGIHTRFKRHRIYFSI
jgi:hypothetical protein